MEAISAATGGVVAQNLDYDIHIMSNFCSWVVFSLFKCTNPNSSPHFQSLLQSVLAATRLPKSTILLGIHYVSMKIDNEAQACHVESQIFETLIIGLLLANKFNDDNTFKNKSWAEATGLNLAKINSLERDWLRTCLWKLHDDTQYSLVESCWKTWCLRFTTAASPSTASAMASASHEYLTSDPTTPFNSIGYSNGYPVNVPVQQPVPQQQHMGYYTNGYYPQSSSSSVSVSHLTQQQFAQQQFNRSIPMNNTMKPPVNYYGYAAVY